MVKYLKSLYWVMLIMLIGLVISIMYEDHRVNFFDAIEPYQKAADASAPQRFKIELTEKIDVDNNYTIHVIKDTESGKRYLLIRRDGERYGDRISICPMQ